MFGFVNSINKSTAPSITIKKKKRECFWELSLKCSFFKGGVELNLNRISSFIFSVSC